MITLRRDGDGSAARLPDPAQLPRILGDNVRAVRETQGLVLDEVSRRSGVSRSTLSQIERGSSMPALAIVEKIAAALGAPLATLLREHSLHEGAIGRIAGGKLLLSADGRVGWRSYRPTAPWKGSSIQSLRLTAGAAEALDPSRPARWEVLAAISGNWELCLGGRRYSLTEGDLFLSPADLERRLSNTGAGEGCLLRILVAFAL